MLARGERKMGQMRDSVSAKSNEGRNAYVVAHITDALMGLLEERPLGQISISELCTRAEVGRASFYRNFSSKEDVLRGRIEHLFDLWGERPQGSENGSISGFVHTMFLHLEEQRAFYQLLAERGLMYLLEDAILARVGFDPDGPREAVYASAYAGYLIYGWMRTWIRRGMRDSADELADMLRAVGL